MKTNILKLSLMALVATACMVGCTQDEDIANVADSNKALKVTATVQGFTPDAATRVTDEANGDDYVTKFEEGDKIGVYVFMEDGTMMCKNLPMTYAADGTWTSETPLYFYKEATYIAYSPYNTKCIGFNAYE